MSKAKGMEINMEGKVYYGEYSLKHWIDLILRKNIILPDYQRYFVWDKNKIKELINAIRENQFVPPVTIGNFTQRGNTVNLILDGQQRLTSILLTYIGIFPNKNTFKNKNIKKEVLANEDDREIDESLFDDVLEWNFNKLIEKGNEKEEIIKKILPGNYDTLDLNLEKEFFDNNFLGFSYLVPQSNDDKVQQRYYSKVFRNINIQGVSLLPQESREALYYLDKDLVKYFKPEFQNEILVNDVKIDFVRYLALIAQYEKDKTADNLAKKFARNMEGYYEKYIYSCINNEEDNGFSIDNIKDYETSFEKLKEALEKLEIFNQYKSIIPVDFLLFGLIYFVVFEKKDINFDKEINLKEKLTKKIMGKLDEIKKDELHRRNPGALKYLRDRVKCSIEVYKEFVK